MKKRKELNLSKLRMIYWNKRTKKKEYYYPEEDVKEFIHRVREGPKKNTALTIENLHKWIGKLAGSKLVGDGE